MSLSLSARPSPPSRLSAGAVRRGVTLLELLVALTIMGIATMFVSATVPLARGDSPEETLTRARRLAIRRGQPLTFARSDSGTWWVIAPTADTVLHGISAPSPALVVRIDAMGSCAPPPSTVSVRAEPVPRFDPLQCRWLEPRP